jgi:hypothetical protein
MRRNHYAWWIDERTLQGETISSFSEPRTKSRRGPQARKGIGDLPSQPAKKRPAERQAKPSRSKNRRISGGVAGRSKAVQEDGKQLSRGAQWTKAQDRFLRQQRVANVPLGEIATSLKAKFNVKRTRDALTLRFRRISKDADKSALHQRNYWTQPQIDWIKRQIAAIGEGRVSWQPIKSDFESRFGFSPNLPVLRTKYAQLKARQEKNGHPARGRGKIPWTDEQITWIKGNLLEKPRHMTWQAVSQQFEQIFGSIRSDKAIRAKADEIKQEIARQDADEGDEDMKDVDEEDVDEEDEDEEDEDEEDKH